MSSNITQEEKELLLKDLCGRLPYGVVCKISYTFNNETTNWEDVESMCDDIITKINFDTKEVFSNWLSEYSSIDDVKPYLRPMSSMTEGEEIYYNTIYTTLKFYEKEDWLNAHHFDYRIDSLTGKTLIENGLALKAPKNMYETE